MNLPFSSLRIEVGTETISCFLVLRWLPPGVRLFGVRGVCVRGGMAWHLTEHATIDGDVAGVIAVAGGGKLLVDVGAELARA